MAQIIWALRAIDDLDSIAEYIASDSEYSAKKFVKELIRKADLLLNYPERGRPIPENILANTDKFFTKAIVFYRLEKKNIIIATVYQQKKLLLKLEDK